MQRPPSASTWLAFSLLGGGRERERVSRERRSPYRGGVSAARKTIPALPPWGPVLRQDGGMPNRLAHETSPYLLQHADNPVDWWPWSPEAFEEARRRDAPV